jgi:hypothetical protein
LVDKRIQCFLESNFNVWTRSPPSEQVPPFGKEFYAFDLSCDIFEKSMDCELEFLGRHLVHGARFNIGS